MKRWGSKLLSVPLVTVALIALIGCQEKELKLQNQTLQNANRSLREDLRSAQENNADLGRQNATLQASLADKDRQITRLQEMVNQPRVEPRPPQPPSGSIDGDTGFSGLGEVSSAGGVVTVTLAGDVLFDSGQAALKSTAIKNLSDIANVIKTKYPGRKIRIRGHTDSDPIKKSSWKDNWDLGFNRARAVGLELIKQGVPANQIEMVGLANTEPRVSPEKTPADKAKNRRVEIQVVVSESSR